jgi:Fe(3+) dicitrate transport protein
MVRFVSSFVCLLAAAVALPATVLAAPAPAPAQKEPETSDPKGLDAQRRILPLELTITKYYWSDIKQLPGAGYYVAEKQIEQTGTTDAGRMMRQIPGVNVQEEDGFGLRPNIGMRGGRIDRSADVTLMEDGVLIAPAPYSAPEAYYFPRMERMTGIEVRKGSSTIKYGPRTTNGAINFLTRSVPDVLSGEVSTSVGSYGGFRSGGHVGDSFQLGSGSLGIMGEFHHESTDGFKDVDIVGGDTGFNISDYMTKLRYKTDASTRFYQEFELKMGYTDEDSNETYLGLTEADFNADPNRRYAASQADRMDAYHHQVQLSHYIEPSSNTSLTTTLYRTDFNRNWYKLNNVRAGTNQSLTSVLDDPITYAAHLAVLQGMTSAADGLTVRANNRDHYGQGVQSVFNYRTNWNNVHHDMEFGLRYHYDEQDRFQHDDIYQMVDGRMVLTTAGAPGSQDNRIGSADAWAAFVQDRMDFGQLALTPGVRMEYIDLETDNYGTADPGRTGANLQHFGSTITAIVPGIGLEYDLTSAWQLLAGVHKGFAPPAPPSSAPSAQSAKEEESINYEAGVRYKKDRLRAEAIAFVNDYENLLGADTFSSGGGTGDQFNGGEVRVWGIEAALGYDLAGFLEKDPGLRFPARVGYTLTRTQFMDSFNSTFSEWGNVSKGDELPYIAPNQLYLSLGVEDDNWLVTVSGKYMDKMRTVAGSGPLLESESTDRSFTVDLYAETEIKDGVRPFVSVNNVFDQTYIAARRPAGLRPGAPRLVYGGVKASF